MYKIRSIQRRLTFGLIPSNLLIPSSRGNLKINFTTSPLKNEQMTSAPSQDRLIGTSFTLQTETAEKKKKIRQNTRNYIFQVMRQQRTVIPERDKCHEVHRCHILSYCIESVSRLQGKEEAGIEEIELKVRGQQSS